MIFFINCKITDVRLNPHLNKRYCLHTDNRFDVARYTFASFAALSPLVSKFVFHLEMADGFAGREQEMKEWLESVFPADKLSMHWQRCNNIADWRRANEEFEALNDDIIYPVGSEDHVFIDSNTYMFRRGLEVIRNDPAIEAVFGMSHYPEGIRYAPGLGGQITSCGNYIQYNAYSNDSTRIMKYNFFEWYLDQIKDPNQLLFRTENWHDVARPTNKCFIPTKELFRHYDGYGNAEIGPELVPPLVIPPKFFERSMTIRYGFDDYDTEAVNINPLAKSLRAADPVNGVDYKFALEDIPMFWWPFIKNVEINPDVDHNVLRIARDLYYIEMAEVDCQSYQGIFNKTNLSPIEWLRNHMLVMTL